MHYQSVRSLSFLLQSTLLILAAVVSNSVLAIPTASVRPLHIFPNGTAGENLFVRADGSVLMTTIYPAAELYYFPANTTNPVLVYNFTGSTAAYGITEYAPDLFAVFTGTFSRSGDVTNATGTAWKVDLTTLAMNSDGSITSPANVSILANMTDVGFLNGAATLDNNTVFVADSVLGVVFGVDTRSGNYSVLLNDTSLAPNTTGPVRLGVNGLVTVNDTLYFTNTNSRAIGKVRLNMNGTAGGPYVSVATNILVDDLEVNPLTGAIYIPSLVANAITYVAPNGTASIIAGSLNSTDVPGPTSIRFAKNFGCSEEQCRYSRLLISTSGGIEYPINGTYSMGGGLYELDVVHAST